MFRKNIYDNAKFSVSDKKGLSNLRQIKGLSEETKEKVLEH
jgi:hypothetical protein